MDLIDLAAQVRCMECLTLLCAVLQIYKAEEPHWPVRVYNLLYEDSQEADKFAAAVAREVTLVLGCLEVSWILCGMALTCVLVCLLGHLMVANEVLDAYVQALVCCDGHLHWHVAAARSMMFKHRGIC